LTRSPKRVAGRNTRLQTTAIVMLKNAKIAENIGSGLKLIIP
jgi:hypothetical protein